MDRLRKSCAELEKDGIDIALISTHENVAYLSGLNTPLPVTYPGETPVAFPMSFVCVDVREKSATLIAVDGLKELATAQCILPRKEFFPAGAELESPRADGGFLRLIQKTLADAGAERSHRRIGVETKALPLFIHEGIARAFPGVVVSEAAAALERARTTKTAPEIEALRKVARVADAAQTALVQAATSFGKNEFEVWTVVLQAVYSAAGEVVPVYGELVTGPRTNEVHYPGGPRDRVIARGDTGIMDISMRVDGYWSDCCNTVVFGGHPGTEQKKYMEAAKECFSAAVAVMRPGIRCCDVTDAIEKAHARHGVTPPGYYGHQIGVVVNEHPKIIRADTTPITAGMVFCIEPGAYAGAAGATGARVEKTVVVTEKGLDVLHAFPWGF